MKSFQIIVLFILCIFNSKAQTCLENGISFFSQNDVDQFAIEYADCDTISGDVYIFGSTITNLESLSNVKSIGGNFTITLTEQLVNTSDLVSLDEIRGAIIITDNLGLVEINEIANLSSSGSSIDIQNNQNLISINGFNSNQNINDIKIINNASLDSVAGFNGLRNVLFDIRFNLNHKLHVINGFNSLDSCRTLFLQNNNGLEKILGFESIRIIESQLSIGSNERLNEVPSFDNLKETKSIQLTDFNTKHFDGFNALKIVQDELQLSQSDSIVTFNCCNNLDFVKRAVFQANRSLESVEAFNNLSSTQEIYFSSNPKMHDFNSFNSLETIDSIIILGGLANLDNLNNLKKLREVKRLYLRSATTDITPNGYTDISGLKNIDPDFLDDLIISHCPNISVCEYRPICDYLEQPDAKYSISNNAEGCNSREEILEACMMVSTQDESFENHLSIYPNPSTGFIYFGTVEDLRVVKYEIFDISGKIVKVGLLANNQIDLTNLENGMYIVTFKTKSRTYNKKVTIANK